MGCVISIVRAVSALVLGVVVFVGFLLLMLTNTSNKLLNADFYNDIIAGEDTYNRIYDEVLLDEDLESTRNDLLGEVRVVSDQELVNLLREIIPPEYLQSQVEGAIGRTVDYFNEDAEALDLRIDLGPALDNVKPVLLRYMNQRIERLPLEKFALPGCDPEIIQRIADRYEVIFRGLSIGSIPESIPSFEAIFAPCRQVIFNIAFDKLVSDPSFDPRVEQGLRARKEAIRVEFNAGDTYGVWQEAAPAMATPLIDDAIGQIRAELDGQERLDLVHRIAIWSGDLTEAQIRENAGDARDWVSRVRKFGKSIALAMLIAGAVLLGLVHFPSLKGALRWPGLTLLLTGVVLLVIGKVLQSQVPDRLRELVERDPGGMGGVPASVNALGGDLLASFGKHLTGGFDGPALAVLIIGALLFGASFFVYLLRPRFPGVR